MTPQEAPIAVLDSGLGGLTVVRALRAALPNEDIIYFGDTARVPYGSKTGATVTSFVRQIIGYLLPQRPKHVVIACNTASALAMGSIRKEFPGLSVSGVIEPGARAAAAAAGAKHFPTIGVIATEATIRSKAYEAAIARRRQHARMVCRATPLLVPIIEEGRGLDDPLVRLALDQYLRSMAERGLDVLVLGCTHYPMLKGLIAEVVGPVCQVIDSAEQCAEDVAHRLTAGGLLRGGGVAGGNGRGGLRCYVTDESPRFGSLASRFLGFEVRTPVWVSPEDLYGAATGSELVPFGDGADGDSLLDGVDKN